MVPGFLQRSCAPRSSNTKLAADDEVSDRPRYEDLADVGQRHDPRGDVHGDAGDVVAAASDLAGVDAGSELETHRLRIGDQRGGAAHRHALAP